MRDQKAIKEEISNAIAATIADLQEAIANTPRSFKVLLISDTAGWIGLEGDKAVVKFGTVPQAFHHTAAKHIAFDVTLMNGEKVFPMEWNAIRYYTSKLEEAEQLAVSVLI